MKTCLIIDDEASARQLLREYVSEVPELQLIGEAQDGPSAVTLISEIEPDLIFLDIEMPGLNGFEVIDRLRHIPRIIFSTAFDNYAIQAFEVHALDYLLKPYTRSRFDKAMERIEDPESQTRQMNFLEDRRAGRQTYPDRFLVEKGSRLVNVPSREVIKMEAYGDYAKLYTAENQYLSKSHLGALEEKLDPAVFIRIHRSTIIQLAALDSLKKYGKGYLAQLSDGSEVKVSRGYADAIKRLIY